MIRDLHPISVVESSGLKHLLEDVTSDGGCQLSMPSLCTLKKRLAGMKKVAVETIRRALKDKQPALTCDLSTSDDGVSPVFAVWCTLEKHAITSAQRRICGKRISRLPPMVGPTDILATIISHIHTTPPALVLQYWLFMRSYFPGCPHFACAPLPHAQTLYLNVSCRYIEERDDTICNLVSCLLSCEKLPGVHPSSTTIAGSLKQTMKQFGIENTVLSVTTASDASMKAAVTNHMPAQIWQACAAHRIELAMKPVTDQGFITTLSLFHNEVANSVKSTPENRGTQITSCIEVCPEGSAWVRTEEAFSTAR